MADPGVVGRRRPSDVVMLLACGPGAPLAAWEWDLLRPGLVVDDRPDEDRWHALAGGSVFMDTGANSSEQRGEQERYQEPPRGGTGHTLSGQLLRRMPDEEGEDPGRVRRRDPYRCGSCRPPGFETIVDLLRVDVHGVSDDGKVEKLAG